MPARESERERDSKIPVNKTVVEACLLCTDAVTWEIAV